MDKLGIEKVSKAIVAAINLGEKIEKNLSDDGKITLTEALGIGASSFGDVVKVIKSGSQIKAELRNLDDEEKAALINLVMTELDLANDKVESIIEKAVEFLFHLKELIDSLKK